MRRALLVYLLTILISAASVMANAPAQMTIQGRATDASGTPLPAGPKTFTFRIFSASAGGTQIWPAVGGEIQSITSGADGLWVGLLGAVNPLTDAVFADSVRWLEIEVNGTILPRVRLVTGPYAYRVSTIDGASGGVITSKVAIGPGNTNPGLHSFVTGGANNSTAAYTTVTGGLANTASGNFSVIGGGTANYATGPFSVVSGGHSAEASDSGAVVGGGQVNAATEINATVGGGGRNRASAYGSTIGGGFTDSASGDFSTISGGRFNHAIGLHSVVGGGAYNIAANVNSTVGGGSHNRALGENATVAGGGGPYPGDSNLALGNWSTVGGGGANRAVAISATIAGGVNHVANGPRASIGGGESNVAFGDAATVAGGAFNQADGLGSVVAGGTQNSANGDWSAIPGGQGNATTASHCLAAGHAAQASHSGSFVWADHDAALFQTTTANQFLIRARGGVGIGTNSPQQALSVSAGMNIDQNNTNDGTTANSLRFGATSGEAIASKRTAGGNQFGLDFYANSINRMSITNGGQVGIGTNAPVQSLDVYGAITAGTAVSGTSRHVTIGADPNAFVELKEVDGSGSPYIDMSNDASSDFDARIMLTGDDALAIDGASVNIGNGNLNIWSGNVCAWNVVCPSDARLKEHVRHIPDALERVANLRGVEYHWTAGAQSQRALPGDLQVGLIAQEVRKVVPQAVVEQEDGYLAVDYARLVPLLIEAVKSQQQTIQKQQQDIEELKRAIAP